MRIRRTVAGLVILAALAVAVPFGDDLWIWLAYEEQDVIEFHSLDTPRFVLGTPAQRSDWTTLATLPAKRASWLPGRNVIVPDLFCPCCAFGVHGFCPRSDRSGRYRIRLRKDFDTEIELPDDFRCDCQQPTHDVPVRH